MSLSDAPLVSPSAGTLINVGMSVWGLDWVPVEKVEGRQYVMVGGSSLAPPVPPHVMGVREHDRPGALQLWSVDISSMEPRHELTIYHPWGSTWSLRFFPGFIDEVESCLIF
jgi:hypothetical protein